MEPKVNMLIPLNCSSSVSFYCRLGSPLAAANLNSECMYVSLGVVLACVCVFV